jgi:hypothetical protein
LLFIIFIIIKLTVVFIYIWVYSIGCKKALNGVFEGWLIKIGWLTWMS